MARDDRNLYILFVLDLGVRERFDNELRDRGKPTSGALGYLKFQTEGRQFSLWIPTGFHLTVDKSGNDGKSEPIADFQASRYNPATKKWDEVFAGESLKAAEVITFEGKVLEIKLPLDKLGVAGTSAFSVSLGEM